MKITKKKNNFTFQAEQSKDVNDAVKKKKKTKLPSEGGVQEVLLVAPYYNLETSLCRLIILQVQRRFTI